MVTWSFCDDLDTPEIGVCMDSNYWHTNYYEMLHWLQENDAGGLIGDRVLLIYEDKRTLFLLKFG